MKMQRIHNFVSSIKILMEDLAAVSFLTCSAPDAMQQ